ncbi:CHASE3 domain-containing protein [Glaciimonas sp. PCH181]|uniref:sensor histidine kinase n=1 Tax=Glaciimonas sp. PCH181 TaxID=2133943 RepID=UPI000D34D400|nr:CHASE3 domain-containing protein [Glaciimonas sp. PCH181]PUA18856.1 histidine kinase [Glaciimonas sp. PCH181]
MKKITSASLPGYVMVLFVICLMTFAATALTTYQNLQKLKQNNDEMEHSWRIKDHLKNINLLIMDAESSLRGYYISDDPLFLTPWKHAKDKLEAEFTTLETLTAGNPVQQTYLLQLRVLFDRKLKNFDETLALYHDGGLPEVVKIVRLGEGKEIMDEVRLVDTIMEKDELELLTARHNRFYIEFNRTLWIGNLISSIGLIILIIFYRLILNNFSKQRAVEHELKLTNENLESTVLARTRQLSILSRHLLKVSEEEKAKLARELHDEMGSALTVIGMTLSNVSAQLKDTAPVISNQLIRAKQALKDTVNLKRRIIEDLRPSMLDNLGLTASIESHCEHIAHVAGLTCETEIAEDFENIDPDWAIALFRIVQESLNNVIKYAHASHVKITLQRKAAGLWLQILDNGIGIPGDVLEKPKSHGLLGMRERMLLLGGSFTIQRGTGGKGTAVEAFIPFPPGIAI